MSLGIQMSTGLLFPAILRLQRASQIIAHLERRIFTPLPIVISPSVRNHESTSNSTQRSSQITGPEWPTCFALKMVDQSAERDKFNAATGAMIDLLLMDRAVEVLIKTT